MNRNIGAGTTRLSELAKLFKDFQGEEMQVAMEAVTNTLLLASKGLSNDELIIFGATMLSLIKHPSVLAEIQDMPVNQIIDELKEGFANSK